MCPSFFVLLLQSGPYSSDKSISTARPCPGAICILRVARARDSRDMTVPAGVSVSTARRAGLGPVEIHRVRIIVAPMWIMASKLVSVLQARIAIRLNSLSF